MKITRIIAFLTAGLVTLALASCKDKDEPDDKADDLSNVTFTVGTSDIDYDNINVIVRHDGPKDITWYGFVSEGNSTDIEALISSRLSEVTEAGLHIGDNQTVHLEGLKDNSVYQYVAFGVNPDKTRFGVPGSCSFTTDMDKNKVTFDLKISNVSYTSAEAEVSLKEGRDDYTWYGVATTDVEAEDAEIISKAIKNLNPSDLYSGTQATVKVDGLSFGTDYKYVVFGITPELVQYGTPSSATFKTESFEFAPKSEWTVTYDGIDSEDKNAPYLVSVTSTEETTAYSVVVLDASAFDENTDPSVIAQNAAGQAYSEVSKAVAAGKSLSDVLKRGTSSTNFKLEMGTYVAVAVGFDAEGMVNGDYALSEVFSLTDNRTPYEKWLGTWAVKRGADTDTWTITKNVENSSYKIDGIDNIAALMTDGSSFPIDALFDPATGNLVIHVQTGLASITLNDGTECSLDLYGVIEYAGKYYYVTGDYDIVTLKYGDNNTATMEGDVLKLSGLEGDFPVIGMRHVLTAEEGSMFVNDDFTPFDQTIRQLTQVDGTGTGDDPGTDPGTDPGSNKGYAGWLGNWTYSDGTNNFNVSITQKTANSTYNVSGFAQEYVYEAVYDSATGAIEINGTQLLDTGIELSNGEVVNLYLLAVDSEDYIEYGNPDKNYRLVIGKLSSDGKSAAFEGDVYDAVYGGQTYHEEIISFGVVGMTEENKLYTLSSYPHANLPGSLSKASSGVSKKVGSGVYAKNPSKVHAASVRGYEKPFSFSGKYAVGIQYYRRAK